MPEEIFGWSGKSNTNHHTIRSSLSRTLFHPPKTPRHDSQLAHHPSRIRRQLGPSPLSIFLCRPRLTLRSIFAPLQRRISPDKHTIDKMFRAPTTNLVRRTALMLPRATARPSSTQALSNPTLKNIEKRWEAMPLQEQAELWMALRDRMKGSWHELSMQEKKAGRFSLSSSVY